MRSAMEAASDNINARFGTSRPETVRHTRRWLAALVLAAFLLPLCTARAAAPQVYAPVVKTRMGEIRGKLDGKVRAFLGIPYAAPPVGDLRWRASQPLAAWTGVLDATNPGNQCTQTRIRDRGVAGSENCLFLNIYAPDRSDQALPVMVWIHGGTFLVGSGAQYDVANLHKRAI